MVFGDFLINTAVYWIW